jgi:hypothetical protein
MAILRVEFHVVEEIIKCTRKMAPKILKVNHTNTPFAVSR